MAYGDRPAPARKRPEWQAFVRAVLWGSLAGAAPILPLTLLVAVVGSLDPIARAIVLIAPLLFSMAFVLPVAVIALLPLAQMLRRTNRESAFAYGLAGSVVGIVVPPLAFWSMEAVALSFAGILAGGTTGLVWWREIEPYRPHPDDDWPAE